MQNNVVYRRPDCYAAFPHFVCDADGALLLVFREAGSQTAEAALRSEHTHQDHDSRILFIRSIDAGQTWSEPVIVYEGEYAVNDPALTVLRDGRYLVRFARWHLVPSHQRDRLPGPVMRHYLPMGQVGTMVGNGFMQSLDKGETWFHLPAIVDIAELTRAMSREAPLELSDGALLLPVYDGYPFHSENSWMLRSWDGGVTWGDAGLIAGHVDLSRPYREVENYNETALLALSDTLLLAVVRIDVSFVTADATFMSEGGVGELGWTISSDVGFTWEPVRPTGLWGQPAHLLVLQDSRLLCTYGHRRAPFGVQAALFVIDGDQWHTTHHIILRDDGPGWDIGYPASAQLPGGDIFTAYYFYQEDGVRQIEGTSWHVEEMIATMDNET